MISTPLYYVIVFAVIEVGLLLNSESSDSFISKL